MSTTEKHLCAVPELEADAHKVALWNEWATTDPAFVKEVNQRGGFSAIATMYKFKRLTEVFGACGKGWGWNAPRFYTVGSGDELVVCEVTFWYISRFAGVEGPRPICEIPVASAAKLFDGNGRPDADAYKKVLTDCLTKAISYLGHSADVFMGRFDDEKYVNELREHFGEEIDEHALNVAANQAAKDAEKAAQEKRKAKREARTPEEIKREEMYGAVKHSMEVCGLDNQALKTLIGYFFTGKSKARDLDLPELEKLVGMMGEWNDDPRIPSALISEIDIAKGVTA